MGTALHWRPSDPGRFALRLALRTGIVVPVALAVGTWAGGEQTMLFAAFGAFATLLFVDFGGPLRVRLLAYGTLAVVSSALIVVGTLCSRHPVLAAAAMLVVGFAVLFSGVLNGYFAAAASGVLLTFVLPAMVPAGASDIGARLGGWWIAVALSVPATLLLFPARPRDRLRTGAAAACRALADYVRAPSPAGEQALAAAVEELHARFEATPYRPTGPTGATGALAAMIAELDWLRGVTLRPAGRDAVLAPTPGEDELRALCADALLASAALVEGREGPSPDRAALERGRERVHDELAEQIAANPADDERLWAALRQAWDVRLLSYITLELAGHAALAGGAAPDDARILHRQGAALAASGRLAAAHAGVRSIWFRNSLRGAIGLSLAVLVAGELSVQHAFWVVLGALSVLRSSALNTGASIVQALLGTLAGIVAGGVLLEAIGGSETALWIALPLSAMLAAYAPRAVSFAAGQAGFTVAVFVIFDLIAGAGWQVGLVRLEDVSIGFAISLGVGLLFWPRGAATLLRGALDDALTTAAHYIEAAIGRLAGGAPATSAALAAAAAEARLDAAFRQRLTERASDKPGLPESTRLMSAAARLRASAESMEVLAGRLGDTPRPEEARALPGDAGRVAAWYVGLGESLGRHAPPPVPEAVDPALHPALIAGVRSASATGSRDRLLAAAAMVWGGLHLEHLRVLEPRCAEAAAELPGGTRG